MTVAATTPSAKDELQRVATVVAASEAGNPKSTQSMTKALQAAEAGAPEGIEAAGKIAAVQALHQVSADKPLAPEMKTAVADLEAAHAGDSGAQQKLAIMQEQASFKIPEAVKYMTYATGAAVVARALADNPVAHDEWLQKAGVNPSNSETKNTVVEAEVVSSYKPDEPLPPIRTTWDLVKAALSALLMATPDPFQNYREGVRDRGQRVLEPVTKTGEDKPVKSDPETKYMVHAPKDPNDKYMVHGDDKSPDPKLVDLTKRRLGDIKAAADKGDVSAQKKWATSNTNYTNKKALATKGDAKAQAIVAVLEATGLFKA